MVATTLHQHGPLAFALLVVDGVNIRILDIPQEMNGVGVNFIGD